MDIAAALIFAVDALVRVAENTWTQFALAGVVIAFAASFAFGEGGARLRGTIVRLFIFGFIGGLGVVTIVAVKGVPAPPQVAAEKPPKPAEQRLDEWLDHMHRRAEAAPDRPPSKAAERPKDKDPVRTQEAPKLDPLKLADEARKLRDLVAARREHTRVRAEVAAIPEAARSPDHHRRDASALRGLAQIDRDEGRIKNALDRYRAAQATFARLADPASRRAGVATSFDVAETLDAQNEETAARAAYRSAIADQRGLAELPEPERRDGVAGALVRYANFETGRRHQEPARAALDEADEHYAAISAQRGKLAVLRTRADLAMAIGDTAAARSAIAAMRALAAEPALTDARAAIDMVEARLELADGRVAEAEMLFARAAAAYRQAPSALEQQRALSAALLGRAEAAYTSRRIATARESAAAAITISRALGDRARTVNALAQLALWEAAAGDTGAAQAAFALALAAQRETGEPRAAADTEATFQILCAGLLRGSEPCKTKQARDAAATGR